MQGLVFPVVDLLSVLTLVGDVIVAGLLLALILRWQKIEQFVSRHGLLLMFIVAVTATLGSLFLSEVAGWTPCKYCWLQRIFMYPQAVMLPIALWKKDSKIATYLLPLCVIGIVLAVIHYSEQIHATYFLDPTENPEPCDETGVSCATTYTFRFGYITVPMMALTAFALNALGSVFVLRRK